MASEKYCFLNAFDMPYFVGLQNVLNEKSDIPMWLLCFDNFSNCSLMGLSVMFLVSLVFHIKVLKFDLK